MTGTRNAPAPRRPRPQRHHRHHRLRRRCRRHRRRCRRHSRCCCRHRRRRRRRRPARRPPRPARRPPQAARRPRRPRCPRSNRRVASLRRPHRRRRLRRRRLSNRPLGRCLLSCNGCQCCGRRRLCLRLHLRGRAPPHRSPWLLCHRGRLRGPRHRCRGRRHRGPRLSRQQRSEDGLLRRPLAALRRRLAIVVTALAARRVLEQPLDPLLLPRSHDHDAPCP
mmetsp:Transcript_26269/g.69680  ORF Transcript_26269/g.69680 Transcript_26269/m.69680 type:complete len:222 (-) Transcript_26269:636-1301(-)